MKRVYVVTTHRYGEVIDTPPRHPLNPPHSGSDWTIHESKYPDESNYREEGIRLIWVCEVAERIPPRPPSKFHPHAGKKKPVKKAAKKPKAKTAPAIAKPAEPPPKAKAAPKTARAPKPAAEPKIAPIPEVAGR